MTKERTIVNRTFIFVFLSVTMNSVVVSQESWRRTYGGLDSDELRSIEQVSTGGFIAGGGTGSFGISGDSYVLRLDENGVVLWSTYFGGQGVQKVASVKEVPDGFIIAGVTSLGTNGGYDMTLSAIDVMGSMMWTKDIGSSDWDFTSDMVVLSDGYLVVGSTFGFGSQSGAALVVRTDQSGDTIWTRLVDGAGNDEASAVCVDESGNVLVCGRMDIDTDDEDGFVSKLDPNGTILWTNRYGGDSTDYFTGITEAWDEGYVVVGATRSYSSVVQVLIQKIGVNGDSLWQRTYGSGGDTEMRRITKATTSGYGLVGYNTFNNAGGRDMFLISVDNDGWYLFGKNYGGLNDEEGYALGPTDDGGYIMAGISNAYGPGILAGYVVRSLFNGETDDDTVYPFLDPVSIPNQSATEALSIFPNPTSGAFNIRSGIPISQIRIFDGTGRIVVDQAPASSQQEFQLDVPAGLYMVLWIDRSGLSGRAPLVVE